MAENINLFFALVNLIRLLVKIIFCFGSKSNTNVLQLQYRCITYNDPKPLEYKGWDASCNADLLSLLKAATGASYKQTL